MRTTRILIVFCVSRLKLMVKKTPSGSVGPAGLDSEVLIERPSVIINRWVSCLDVLYFFSHKPLSLLLSPLLFLLCLSNYLYYIVLHIYIGVI